MFYGTETGDRLVNEDNYPSSIVSYLKQEKSILEEQLAKNDLLIEVGCMEARNLDVAIKNGKKYIGIDIIKSYIDIASEIAKKRGLEDTCEFLCIDAEKLDNILGQSKLLKKAKSPLFFFPFNSFGNMENYENVIKSMKKIKNADFIIFSYNTDSKSNEERFKYYENCNYDNLEMINSPEGIRFVADNGLSSIAYNKAFLDKKLKSLGLNVDSSRFGDIGMVYFINTREKEQEL